MTVKNEPPGLIPQPVGGPLPAEPLTAEQLADLRQRVLAGERLTPELSRRVVETRRSSRTAAAAVAKAKGGSKRKTKVMSDDELFADLDSFLGGNSSTKQLPGIDGDSETGDDAI